MMVGIYWLEMCLQFSGLLGIFGAALTDIEKLLLTVHLLAIIQFNDYPSALIKKQIGNIIQTLNKELPQTNVCVRALCYLMKLQWG